MDEAIFTSADGIEIFYRRWRPDGRQRGSVLIAHGASEHSGRYARFASVLTAAGFGVYALDQRGHGRTGKSSGPGRMGARGQQGLLDDLAELERRARAEAPSAPVLLFGHSMGSLIAQAYAEQRGGGLAGLVLSGSLGVMDGFAEIAAGLEAAVVAGQGDEALNLLGALNAAFEPARTGFDWLSRDPREVDAYIADPFCGDNWPLSNGYMAQIFALAMTAMSEAAIAQIPKRLPVLLITGEADSASNMALQVRELEKLLRAAGLAVTANYYAEARHELLNETNRDAVHADVVAWLDGVAPLRAGGA